MEFLNEKLQAFEKAKEWQSRNDEDSTRYLALELRRCIEAVFYEKLWAYRDRIPVEVARKWQPPQALKALLLIEPDADQPISIAVAPQSAPDIASSGPYKMIGTDHRPNYKWLLKTWNSLGSLLHASFPFQRKERDTKKYRALLANVVSEIEPYVLRSITATLANVITFNCIVCGFVIAANELGIEKTGEATCLNPDCACRFFAKKDAAGEFNFILDTSSGSCPDCKREIHIPTQKLTAGFLFSCPACSGKFGQQFT